MSDALGFLAQTVAGLVAGGVAAAAIVWLAKTTISARLKGAIRSEYDLLLESHKNALRIESDSKLELLRSELRSRNDIELERLRSSLNIEAAERQIHVAGLYERRADALQSIYALLSDLHDKLVLYVDVWQLNGGPSKEDLRKSAADSYDSFAKSYKPLLIFLPAPVATELRNIEWKARSAYNRFAIIVQDRDTESALKQWIAISEDVNGDIRKGMDSLEKSFREMLDWRPTNANVVNPEAMSAEEEEIGP